MPDALQIGDIGTTIFQIKLAYINQQQGVDFNQNEEHCLEKSEHHIAQRQRFILFFQNGEQNNWDKWYGQDTGKLKQDAERSHDPVGIRFIQIVGRLQNRCVKRLANKEKCGCNNEQDPDDYCLLSVGIYLFFGHHLTSSVTYKAFWTVAGFLPKLLGQKPGHSITQ